MIRVYAIPGLGLATFLDLRRPCRRRPQQSSPRRPKCLLSKSRRQLRYRPNQLLLSMFSTAPVCPFLLLCSYGSPLCRAVCTFPPEYCEFGSSLTRCKEWLQKEYPDLYQKYYSEGSVSRGQPSCELTVHGILRGPPSQTRDTKS